MKKIANLIALISIIIFIFTWLMGGLMILEHNYDNYSWIYVGSISIIIFFIMIIYLKILNKKTKIKNSKNLKS